MLDLNVKFFGIASRQSGDVDVLRLSREEAEAELAQVLADEPDWAADLWVEAFEFEVSPN